MNHTTCPICKSEDAKKLINWKEYKIYKCNHCNLIYTKPLPDDKSLMDFYQGFLYNIPDPHQIRSQIEKRKKELKKLFSFPSSIEGKTFLDYGGGTGSAYKAAKELKLSTYYQDWDENAKDFVKETHGLEDDFVIDDIESTEIKFDYILSDNVIEHVKDPVDYLIKLKKVQNTKGKIVIKTPNGRNTESIFYPMVTIRGYFLNSLKYNNFSSSLSAYFSRFWHCDPPRHLYSFSEPNLRLVAKQAGFSDNEISFAYYRLPLFKYSISEIFLDFRKRHSIKSFFIRILLLPFIAFELVTKIIQLICTMMGILTPSGITLILENKKEI